MGLLGDGDPRVRATSGLLRALLARAGVHVLPSEAPASVAGRLRDAVAREGDPVVRFGQVMALGTAVSRLPDGRGWLRSIETGADLDDAAGLAAALRLIDLGETFDDA